MTTAAGNGSPEWVTGDWELGPYYRLRRALAGPAWPAVSDHSAQVCILGTEWEDGSFDPPSVHLRGALLAGGLNSGQAAELGSALLEAASTIGRWVQPPRSGIDKVSSAAKFRELAAKFSVADTATGAEDPVLSVRCPLCGAQPGQPCEDVSSSVPIVRAGEVPHMSRLQAATDEWDTFIAQSAQGGEVQR
ncbi:hypothetical protein AAHS21_31430 [Mycobacterium sp. 050272]|uniref:zinc finger domain-containing protein n=1 Tax=Mycobacterium sp. 050272 TaxID=3142488 RepID=UPI00319A4470